MASRSRRMVPEANEAMDRFKMEAANEVGVLNTLNKGFKTTILHTIKRLKLGVFYLLINK